MTSATKTKISSNETCQLIKSTFRWLRRRAWLSVEPMPLQVVLKIWLSFLLYKEPNLTCCSTGEMEEARALLDSAERGKRQTEAELAESRAAVNEMNMINSKVQS